MVALPEWTDAEFEIPGAEAFLLSPGEVFCTKGKKTFDKVVAFSCVVVLCPFLFLIAFVIACDSRGPILFCQKRLGKDGKPFIIYKFRTMHSKMCNAFGGTQATQNDPRITRVGRFLRRTSLDELPQLVNVLRGDMSLVGPRPHAVAHDMYFSQHVDLYWKRYAVKPGLTGWAQVNGHRGETPKIDDMAARVELDMDYIRRRTWIMDIKIAARTLAVMACPPKHLN